MDFQQKEAELFAPHSVPAWFTWDTKLGNLTLHFETPQVFAAEVYAHTMGLQVTPLPDITCKAHASGDCAEYTDHQTEGNHAGSDSIVGITQQIQRPPLWAHAHSLTPNKPGNKALATKPSLP